MARETPPAIDRSGSIATHEHRGFRSQQNEHYPAADYVECLHDLRLVWTFEVRPQLASVESNPGLVGDRAGRILPGGAGEPPGLWQVLGIPAQDHSRGRHAPRFHWICYPVSARET